MSAEQGRKYNFSRAFLVHKKTKLDRGADLHWFLEEEQGKRSGSRVTGFHWSNHNKSVLTPRGRAVGFLAKWPGALAAPWPPPGEELAVNNSGLHENCLVVLSTVGIKIRKYPVLLFYLTLHLLFPLRSLCCFLLWSLSLVGQLKTLWVNCSWLLVQFTRAHTCLIVQLPWKKKRPAK